MVHRAVMVMIMMLHVVLHVQSASLLVAWLQDCRLSGRKEVVVDVGSLTATMHVILAGCPRARVLRLDVHWLHLL